MVCIEGALHTAGFKLHSFVDFRIVSVLTFFTHDYKVNREIVRLQSHYNIDKIKTGVKKYKFKFDGRRFLIHT